MENLNSLDMRLPTIFQSVRDHAPPLGAFVCTGSVRFATEAGAPARIQVRSAADEGPKSSSDTIQKSFNTSVMLGDEKEKPARERERVAEV